MSARPKLKSLIGLFRFLLLLTLILIVLGYGVFVRAVTKAAPPPLTVNADGIVVLTGGPRRLEIAGQLLAGQKAERLLVSGIGANVPPEDIRKLLGVSQAQFACCVDLDGAALDTIGNARETAVWVNALGYEHIILVTSDFHMPRAKLEISSATGGLRVSAYPVTTLVSTPLWRDGERMKTLAREYAKLLVVYVSRMGDRPSHPPQPSPSPTDVMKQKGQSQDIVSPVPTPPETHSPAQHPTQDNEQNP